MMRSDETSVLVAAILAEGERTGDLAAAFQIRMAPELTFHLPNGEEGGATLYKAFMREVLASFPDVSVTVESSMADGDRAMFQFRMEGTHEGTFRGFPPTGCRFSIPICWIVRFADGRIVEIWFYSSIYDFLVPVYLGQQPPKTEAI